MHTIGSICSASGVMSKIASITAGFRNANDYMNNTGAGIDQDTDPDAWNNFFENTVLKACPAYHLLEETLSEYPNAVPTYVVDSADVVSVESGNETSGSSTRAPSSSIGHVLKNKPDNIFFTDSEDNEENESTKSMEQNTNKTILDFSDFEDSDEDNDDGADAPDANESGSLETQPVLVSNSQHAKVSNTTFNFGGGSGSKISPIEGKRKIRAMKNGMQGGRKVNCVGDPRKRKAMSLLQASDSEGVIGVSGVSVHEQQSKYMQQKTDVLLITARNEARRLEMDEAILALKQKKMETEEMTTKLRYNMSVHKARVEAKKLDDNLTNANMDDMFPYMVYKD